MECLPWLLNIPGITQEQSVSTGTTHCRQPPTSDSIRRHEGTTSVKTEIIAVGTELLMGQVVNTNAAEIARMLADIGVGVHYQTVVGDNPDRLADALTTAIDRADLVIACGGLGPTDDDLTRETLAAVLDLPLVLDKGWEQCLRERFARYRWDRRPGVAGGDDAEASGGYKVLPANNLRQAMIPTGAVLLPNSRGSAPGIFLNHNGATIVLIPGPPGEMRGLMHDEVLPRLTREISAGQGSAVLVSRTLRVVGIGESRAAELLADLLSSQTNPTIAPLAQPGELYLRITCRAQDRQEASRLIEKTATEIRAVLGDAIYGEDETSLEAATGELLAKQEISLALAESCTGGLVGHRITNVAGSSRFFNGAIVAYSYEMKSSLLKVDPDLILREGAVSEAVARAMARGARTVCGSDIALAITGIAGPGGGTETKPVGLVYISIADARGERIRQFLFPGDREEIKMRTSQAALEMLRSYLLERHRTTGS